MHHDGDTPSRGRALSAVSTSLPLPPHELSGPPGAPLVVVLGGVSATSHVVATAADPSPGWWEPVVGPAGAIDTTRWRVLGVDWLDGGHRGDGRPERVVTTHDQAAAVAAVLGQLGERRAYAVVGASYGGMVALALAERFPERAERIVVFSAAHESHPMSTALRSLQRRVVELGLDTGRVLDAVTIARGIGMTTYRTAREFGERFADPAGGPARGADGVFEVERYLMHVGRRYADRFSTERFLSLSLSADLHHVDPARVRTPAVLVAAEGDTLVPEEQIRALAARLAGPRRLVTMPTRFGHDAFLIEPAKVGRILTAALAGEITSKAQS
ncbi:MAG: homoserine O-succinyltransferase [Gemmatimonadaceae bacterium]